MVSELMLADYVGMFTLDWESANPWSSSCLLKQDEVHLWVVDLDSQEQGLKSFLTPSDHRRAKRIVNVDKRHLYLGGRAGIRMLLSAYAGVPLHEICFEYGPRGKPSMPHSLPGRHIRFNYSLSHNKALFAISLNCELGVDIEVLPRSIKADSLAAKKLTRRECAAWIAMPQIIKNDAMLCCWTRKEAYGKVLGVGIRYHLAQVALFEMPEYCWFSTVLTGLFRNTARCGMPDLLAGVQVQMPFPAVASLVYSGTEQLKPAISARQLVL